MLKVALTGGIATGKSHVLGRFAALGIPTIDADRLAREVLEPGQPACEAVVRRFGRGIIDDRGEIDRRALAALIFDDVDARHALEAIVHPTVYDAIAHWFDELGHRGDAPMAVADIPLLFETGRQADFDRVVVTRCAPELQLRRVRDRDGATDVEARQRLDAQWPTDRKVARADHVIDTSGTFAETDRQVDALYERLAAEARRA
jgi:dephospho-CoA kinase